MHAALAARLHSTKPFGHRNTCEPNFCVGAHEYAQWHAALAARLCIAMRADFPREGARLFSRAPRRFALAARHVSKKTLQLKMFIVMFLKEPYS